MASSEFETIISQVEMMNNMTKDMEKNVCDMVENTYGLRGEVVEFILPITKENIFTTSMDDLRRFYKEYLINTNDEKYEKLTDEDIRTNLSNIKDASLAIIKMNNDLNEVFEEVHKYIDNYMKENNTSTDKRADQIKVLEEANKLERDPLVKAANNRKIDVLKSTLDYSFMLERILKLGDDEVENIYHKFINEREQNYVAKRYIDKIARFGYRKDIYTHFLSIEENFLPEEYHPLNNLFAFNYMRFVAYSDPYNKEDDLKVKAITVAIANLVYHKFQHDDKEKEFIEFIKAFDDRFLMYAESLKTKNKSYKNSPDMVKLMNNISEAKKRIVIEKLNKLHITGYDVNDSYENLFKLYSERVDAMKEAQAKDIDTVMGSDDVDKNISGPLNTSKEDHDQILNMISDKPEIPMYKND